MQSADMISSTFGQTVTSIRDCTLLTPNFITHYIQLANQLASLFRSASELDSVMQFVLSGAIQLATSSLAGRRPAANRFASYLDMLR